MRKPLSIRFGIVVAAALLGAVASTSYAAESASECKTDSDCVPLECCHATRCGPRDEAPECTQVVCTAECHPRTLDCGGVCACTTDGHCVAKLKDEPSP